VHQRSSKSQQPPVSNVSTEGTPEKAPVDGGKKKKGSKKSEDTPPANGSPTPSTAEGQTRAEGAAPREALAVLTTKPPTTVRSQLWTVWSRLRQTPAAGATK
jgi:hypothetical protein